MMGTAEPLRRGGQVRTGVSQPWHRSSKRPRTWPRDGPCRKAVCVLGCHPACSSPLFLSDSPPGDLQGDRNPLLCFHASSLWCLAHGQPQHGNVKASSQGPCYGNGGFSPAGLAWLHLTQGVWQTALGEMPAPTGRGLGHVTSPCASVSSSVEWGPSQRPLRRGQGD